MAHPNRIAESKITSFLGDIGSIERKAGLLRAVVHIHTAGWLKTWLSDLLAAPVELHRVASQSYVHSNGFDKIVLLHQQAEGWKLVVHLWHQPSAAQSGNFHNHRWDFASLVLVGALAMDNYEVSSGGSVSVTEFEYRVPEHTEDYPLKRLYETALVPLFGCTAPAGTAYYIDHRIIHRATSGGSSTDPTITLMLEDRVVSRTTRVFAELDTRPAHVPVRAMAPDELRIRLEQTLAIL